MEPEKGKKENLATENYSGQVIDDVKKFSQSLTLKGFIIGFLSLVLLIPSFIIMSLINERERLSETKTREINKSWSAAQTICPPVLAVPYTLREISEKDGK
ncbi:MAG: cell envelope integrity protein CreD, partial [Dysgonamonadaceae bacterium]|nr:cell envelope integrity protein CreD [Dysgonamonadaceae bacterium]